MILNQCVNSYFMKLHKELNFADTIFDLRSRKIKNTFFTQVNTLVDWNKIEKLIDKNYSKGKSVTCTPSYNGLCFINTNFSFSLNF